jgi:DNA modification methylase
MNAGTAVAEPYYADDMVTLWHGDNRWVLADLPTDSIDACVTDPPYELAFMGRKWDASGIAYDAEVWAQVFRVLKPGGHLLAFGGTRTWHRLAVAIEDAGFEVRDSIAWMYGSGFPKSLDVSKAIDKAAGAQREVVGSKPWSNSAQHFVPNEDHTQRVNLDITAPATPAAKQWSGFGTALKPAHEPIVVARKPLIGTVAENVLAHGTGALNIDGCRIGYASDADKEQALAGDAFKRKDTSDKGWSRPWMEDAERVERMNREAKERAQGGRWPANVILDESQAAELDRQSGVVASSGVYVGDGLRRSEGNVAVDFGGMSRPGTMYCDTGGASRFFYVPKANSSERPRDGDTAHPTVKPVDLMRYLVKLVTPPGGTVLEPFAGSGTTAEACVIEGFRCIAIEMTEDYLPLITQRLSKPIEQVMW